MPAACDIVPPATPRLLRWAALANRDAWACDMDGPHGRRTVEIGALDALASRLTFGELAKRAYMAQQWTV